MPDEEILKVAPGPAPEETESPAGGSAGPDADEIEGLSSGPTDPAGSPKLGTPSDEPAPGAEVVPKTDTPAPALDTDKIVQELAGKLTKAISERPAAEPVKTATATQAEQPMQIPDLAKPEDMDVFLRGGQEAATYLNNLLKQHLAVVAQLTVPYVEKIKKELSDQVSPLSAHYEQAQADHHRQVFGDKHPDLKDWIPEAEQIAQKLAEQNPKRWKNVDELYTEVAQATRALKSEYQRRMGKESGARAKVPPPAVGRRNGVAPRHVAQASDLTDDQKDMAAIIRGED